ncbi:uncharacterized protein LOC114753699 [Neltuma alba]|uniref:uncharacterized protein LOC114753699 n=1 Tax=Neltuma alba TaxID=207710 RepID=UPI0010A47605|nr:uncharacterized protein LOC114753699 [Prosopis alba]
MDADLSKQGYDCEEDEGASSPSACGCFRRIICSPWRRSAGYVLHQKEEAEEGEEEVGGGSVKEKWWEKKMKKVKEISEILGGPKWKNYLRYRFRFRMSQKMKRMQFQYDPKSYALNFDEGHVEFSARFASPVDTRE